MRKTGKSENHLPSFCSHSLALFTGLRLSRFGDTVCFVCYLEKSFFCPFFLFFLSIASRLCRNVVPNNFVTNFPLFSSASVARDWRKVLCSTVFVSSSQQEQELIAVAVVAKVRFYFCRSLVCVRRGVFHDTRWHAK